MYNIKKTLGCKCQANPPWPQSALVTFVSLSEGLFSHQGLLHIHPDKGGPDTPARFLLTNSRSLLKALITACLPVIAKMTLHFPDIHVKSCRNISR